ncbi:hypothetical protein ACKWTF_014175 [Chironomus riparius]
MKIISILFLSIFIAFSNANDIIPSSVNVSCSYKAILIEYSDNTNVCEVTNFLQVLDGIDEHSLNFTTIPPQNITGFTAANMKLQRIPKGIDKFIPNLVVLSITNSELKAIVPEDLQPFPLLKIVNLTGNEIEILQENLFVFNPNLQVLSLDSNKIKQIHPKVFENLKELIYLGLMDNICVDLRFSDPNSIGSSLAELNWTTLCSYANDSIDTNLTSGKTPESTKNFQIFSLIVTFLLFLIIIIAFLFARCNKRFQYRISVRMSRTSNVNQENQEENVTKNEVKIEGNQEAEDIVISYSKEDQQG